MAKVYSWEIDEGQYAYIANPTNLESYYIGSELDEANLKKVTDWVQTCTDTQYVGHFNAMVEGIKSVGYNITFEAVDSYMNVAASCDLRGPQGRGILRLDNPTQDGINNETVYRVVYTDNTYGELRIKNGAPGTNGTNGKDGANGDAGISTITIFAYASGKDGKPTWPGAEGSYDFTNFKMTYPSGWTAQDKQEEVEPPVYQISRTFASNPLATDPYWSPMQQITGDNGKPGADGISTEFIYLRRESPISGPPETDELPSDPDNPDVVPTEYGWFDSPQGVDSTHLVEYVSTRKKDNTTGKWGAWSPATVWSQYGVNGQDGDGVEYIYFLASNGLAVPNPTPSNYDTDPDYQNKDIEWVPKNGSYTNINGETVVITDESHWTDSPCGVTASMQYEWVAQRKYRKTTSDSETSTWQAFSNPTLWAKYGESGTNGTSVRTMYHLGDLEGNAPDVIRDNVTSPGGQWQNGFPNDYEKGKNCVWGITGVIYGHNNTFVGHYMLIKDETGNAIVPTDATDNNTMEVDALPNFKLNSESIIYVKYADTYYEWNEGGWEGPYLVTGLPGVDGSPIDYNDTVFCYAPKDYPPAQPATGITKDELGQSEDALGNKWTWYDFPDTELGIDGELYNGLVMRWYQCIGTIDSVTHLFKKWGAVNPNTPMDGETLAGPYMEFRFAVTSDEKTPELHGMDSNGPIREPVLYNNLNEQIGWYRTDKDLPDMTSGSTMWQIWGMVDGASNTMIVDEAEGKAWFGPKRVSGEKGDQGEAGPMGMRGVTGLPGAGKQQMFCLGLESIPFGTDEYKDFSGLKYGKHKSEFTTWYKSSPSSIIIKVDSIELAQQKATTANIGRVINVFKQDNKTVDGSQVTTTAIDILYIVEGDNVLRELSGVTRSEDGMYHIYTWCIMGSDVYEAGTHKRYVELEGTPEDAVIGESGNTYEVNELPTVQQKLYKYVLFNGKYHQWVEIEGDEVQHIHVGVAWEDPFRTQGVDGLMGIAGNRGQVIYPMGIYNENEVYVTTKDKAPYVYDPSDGLFYVLNRIDDPWVGKLPEDPEGWTGTTPYYQTITIISGYDEYGQPIETYKYQYEGEWIVGDQDGDRPCKNYANNSTEGGTPAWERFESFDAIYANIGIIENGMIGSAVYNNEFMFSQQGIDKNGNATNYAEASAKPPINSGFLSGYEHNPDGEEFTDSVTGQKYRLYWHYRNHPDQYISESDVNPYAVYTKDHLDKGICKENEVGKPIHTFRPNVCINFSTGQMWSSTGRVKFDANGSGYLLNGKISWNYGDNNVPVFQLGEDGTHGIRFSGSNMTIGLLDDFKTQYNNDKEAIEQEIEEKFTSANTFTQGQIDAINQSISALTTDVQDQLDGKINTWANAADPSVEWINTTELDSHLGDVWYKSDDGETYTFKKYDRNNPPRYSVKVSNSEANTIEDSPDYMYAWESTTEVSLLLFDYADSKSSIFYNTSPTGYSVNDIWMVPSGQTGLTTAYTVGDIVVCATISKPGKTSTGAVVATGFTVSDWVKFNKYTDNSFAEDKFNEWASDNKLSPPERKELKLEADAIAQESGSTYSQACKYLGQTDSQTLKYADAAATAYNTAMYYYTGVTTDLTKTIDISGTTTTSITKNNYDYNNIKFYYQVRQETQDAVVNKVNDNIPNIPDIPDVEYLKSIFPSISDNNGATLAKYLGIKDDTNNIIAYLDGSGMINDTSTGGKGKLILASGIPTGTDTLANRAVSAATKLYNDGTFETKKGVFNGKIKADVCALGNLLISNDLLSFYADNKKSNFVITTDNGTDSADGISFTSSKGNIDYYYSIGDYGPTGKKSRVSIGFDNNGNITEQITYNNGTYYNKGALFAMVTTGYANDTNFIKDNGKYFTPTYTALRIVCDVKSSTKQSYAIGCPAGMYAGLRPCITTTTASTYTADIFDHTIIMTRVLKKDKNGETDHTVTVNIPRNPPVGQEYVIIHTGAATASVHNNKSHFFIKLTGSGTATIKNVVAGADDKGTEVEWRGNIVEARMFFDGTSWWLTYNSWEGKN